MHRASQPAKRLCIHLSPRAWQTVFKLLNVAGIELDTKDTAVTILDPVPAIMDLTFSVGGDRQQTNDPEVISDPEESCADRK